MKVKIPWKVSLHGGHSRVYCDHARSTLREILDSASAKGFRVFGVTEHAPRLGKRFLYPEEVKMGWTVDTIVEKFDEYARDIFKLRMEYKHKMRILCGFETEGVPHDKYADIMLGYKKKYKFDYMVGSIHHVDDTMIDYDKPTFQKVADKLGGVEKLAIRYYELVAEMVQALKPEVVGHFDLIRKCAPDEESVSTPKIKQAAIRALERVKEHRGILDINTAGYRKGLGRPYVAPWLMHAVKDLNIPVCFGDDSHAAEEVGAGLEDARMYLIRNGVTRIQCVRARGAYPLV